jgi:thermostable 8-oxoguanine DNA glycosylase
MVGVEDSCPIEGHLLHLLTEHKAILEKKYSTTMDLYLHCGETVCTHNTNLDLVLSHVKDVKRIGHAV